MHLWVVTHFLSKIKRKSRTRRYNGTLKIWVRGYTASSFLHSYPSIVVKKPRSKNIKHAAESQEAPKRGTWTYTCCTRTSVQTAGKHVRPTYNTLSASVRALRFKTKISIYRMCTTSRFHLIISLKICFSHSTDHTTFGLLQYQLQSQQEKCHLVRLHYFLLSPTITSLRRMNLHKCIANWETYLTQKGLNL